METSYKSPVYDALDADVTARHELPPGLLAAVRLRGERSNADQVSDAGARTVYQIIPATRDAAIKKWGIDPYLNEANAAEVAGRVLKESLERNKGAAPLAVAEYIGGTDPKAWGPETRAYVRRVTGQSLNPRTPATATASLANVIAAYKAGQMEPADKAEFEADIRAGKVILPRNSGIDVKTVAPVSPAASGATMAPQGVIDAYTSGKMTPEERREFETDVSEKRVAVPDGVKVEAPQGMLARAAGAVADAVLPSSAAVDVASGAGEVALALGTGTAATVAGAAKGLAYGLTNDLGTPEGVANAAAEAKRVAEAGTYQPRTATGKAMAADLGAAFDASKLQGLNPAEVAMRAPNAAQAAKPAVARAVAAVEDRLPAAAVRAPAGGAPGAVEGAAARAAAEAAPVPAVTPEAVQRLAELDAKATGAPAETLKRADGTTVEVKGRPPEILTDAEKVERDTLRAQVTAAEAPPAAVVPGVPLQSAEELAATARKASGGGMGSGKATAELAAQTAPDAATVAAMDELGFHYQPDHVTTNQAYRELAQAVKSVPGSQTRAAELEILAHNAQKADELITQLGGSRDLSALSASVKTELDRIHTDLKKQAKEIYTEIDKKIPPTTPAPAPDVLAIIAKRAEALGGESHLTPGEKKIIADLTPKAGKEPTYALLDQVRKDIGAAKRGANETFGTRDTKILGDLEAALRSDQGRVAEAQGAGQLWEAANATTRAYKAIQDDLVSLFGKTLEKSIVGNLNAAVGNLTKGDVSHFVKLIKAIPESMRREVVASGLSSAFGVNARNGSINFNSYTKWYEGLQKNSVARDALFANLPPEAVKSLTNLYKASKGISAATRERITTGRIQAVSDELLRGDSLMGRVFDVAKKSGAMEAITSTMGLPGVGLAAGLASALSKGKTSAMKAADALINSPEFIAAARHGTRQNIQRLARSKAFGAFARASGNPAALKDREKWVAEALRTKGKK